jgi:hypothetical protein
MAQLTKAQLATENQNDFPNNNIGQITPAILRGFNTDMIDSLVDEVSYNIDSASFSGSITQLQNFSSSLDATFATDAQLTSLSASIAVTDLSQSSSIAALQVFSSSLDATFATDAQLTALSTSIAVTDLAQSASIAQLQSFSSSLNTGFVSEVEFGAYTSSNDSKVNSLIAATASYVTEAESGSFVTSVLAGGTPNVISVTKGNGTINTITVNNVTSASFAVTASEARNVVLIARNQNASTLQAGTLVHIVDAVGDNPIFNTASFDTETLSANTLGMLRTPAASGADVEVLVNGIVTGVNTDPALGYVAGDILYLSSSGQFTRVQPQAPKQIVTIGQVLRAQQNNGSIYVNITNGWEIDELHNVAINNVADGDLLVYRSGSGLWTNSSSLELGNATTGSNTFGGTQTMNNLVVNGTASFAYTQTVTGSAVIIGEEFIILNNQTPTAPYAGLKIYDSGSAGVTASLLWDGVNDHWVYEQVSGAAYGAAGFLSGPTGSSLSSIIYPTANRLVKGGGSDHLYDSNISDDGTIVRSSTNVLVTGSVTATGGFIGNASTATTASFATTALSASFVQSSSFAENAGLLDGKDSTEFATTGSNIFVGNQTITGSVILSSSADVELQVIGNQSNTGSFLMSGSFRALVPQPASLGTVAPLFLMTGSLGQTLSQNISRQGGGANDATLLQFQVLSGSATTGDTLQALQTIGVTNNTSTFMTGSSVNCGITSLWATGSGGGRVVYSAAVSTTAQSGSATVTIAANSIKLGSATANIIHITGSTQLFNTLQVRQAAVFSSSLAVSQSQVTLQNSGAIALAVRSGSVEITTPQGEGYFYSNLPMTSSNLRINGPAIVADLFVSGVFGGNSSLNVSGNSSFTGSVFTSASVSGVVNPLTISSNTASLDFSKGNFFTIQLVSGSSTHINPTNVIGGQTVNIRVNTTGSGTVTFPSIIKQASGSLYTPTTSTGVDVLTMVTFDASNVYLANVKNLV